MATHFSAANGNFNTMSSWLVTVAAADLDSEAANTALTTSYVASSTFTPGAVTIDGIAVKIASRAASPNGTISVELFNSTGAASVVGTEITLNVSDIDAGSTAALGGCGWYLFKFAAPILLIAATNYSVRAKTSVAAQVNLFRDATAANWSRALRTTTAPSSFVLADRCHVAGEHTGAGTGTNFTITMDRVSGDAKLNVTVNKRGTLSYSTATSSNFLLDIQGTLDLSVYGGAVFNMGTSLSPIPASSTATLSFTATGSATAGLKIVGGGTFTAYGDTARVPWVNLTSDIAAAGTVLAVSSTSGWINNDTLALSSTSRTAAEAESRTISSVDNSTQVTLSSGVTNAHSGTAPTQGEAANLTRNVVIKGTSATMTGYINFATSAAVEMSWVEIYWVGSATATRRGIDFLTTTGSVSMIGCSVHDCTVVSALPVNITAAASDNIILNNNVFYLNTGGAAISLSATTGTNISITNNLVIRSATNSMLISDVGITFTGNVVTSSVGVAYNISQIGTLGTFSNLTAHSNAGNGFTLSNISGNISNVNSWRNTGIGITIDVNSATAPIFFDTINTFGNSTQNVSITTIPGYSISFKNSTFSAGATLTCPIGLQLAANTAGLMNLDNCTFGTLAHSTADIVTLSNFAWQIYLSNTSLLSATEITGQSLWTLLAFISSDKHDGSSQEYRKWLRYGNTSDDMTIFRSAPMSFRATPNTAGSKLGIGYKKISVEPGNNCIVSVYVRESVIGDGAAYNGGRIRLMLKTNAAMGVNSDTVIATATAASSGAFELLTGSFIATDTGVLEFYVDCDGTTGWINVDDFTTNLRNSGSTFKYAVYGDPYLAVEANSIASVTNLSRIIFPS